MRLRTVSCHQPGWRRIRRGRGFSYVDQRGEPLPADVRERLRALAIPPAWTEVWICPYPRGHLQAVGTDADGRRQYLYHPEWRIQRDLEKFERVSAEARELPRLRRRLRRDMRAAPGDDLVERRRMLAASIRLLDLGCFRPGSDAAAETGSHGLTTLERQHVQRADDGVLIFDFEGKAGIEHEILIDDRDVVSILGTRLRQRIRTPRVLVSKMGAQWVPITAEEINRRIQEITGTTLTAKDFRTWHATTTAACRLAALPQPTSQRGRQRRIREACEAAADLLGNTPAVARSAYIDPRVVELFNEGKVLDPIPTSQNGIDRAVADLLED